MLLTFNQATPDELPEVLETLNDAARWLSRRNIHQWPAEFGNAGDWRTVRIAKYIQSGQTWIVRFGGEPVAAFSLTDAADPDFAHGWPHEGGEALYIFRMAVRRAWSGRDIGGRILDWASVKARAEGKAWLRLDCHRHNRALQRYYEDRGFIRVGTAISTIDDNGKPYTRGSGALYQRPAGAMHCLVSTKGSFMQDRYDPTGEASIWQQAAELITTLKVAGDDMEQWNAAIEQAARVVENEARAIRQRDGMYYRVISGRPSQSDHDDRPSANDA